MKILIDIGHPAHVHYFKNFIRIMQGQGHRFAIVARDKEVTHQLMRCYHIDFSERGKGGDGILGKMFYIAKADYRIYRIARSFRPDYFLSFASTYAAHAAWLMGKPHIAFDDTEHSKWEILLYRPFTTTILNPSCFKKKMGGRQIFFHGYMELCYLHSRYFLPDPTVLESLGLKKEEKYALFRFVSWKAGHDLGKSGLKIEEKMKLIHEISKYLRVVISSEAELPEEMKPYQIRFFPEKIHDIIHHASMVISEGATMASEAAMLGTPAIYINPLSAGTLEDQSKYGLIFMSTDQAKVLEKINEWLRKTDLKEEWQQKRNKMLSEKIDVTAFMVWFIENYPQSVKIMKETPEYQFRFR